MMIVGQVKDLKMNSNLFHSWLVVVVVGILCLHLYFHWGFLWCLSTTHDHRSLGRKIAAEGRSWWISWARPWKNHKQVDYHVNQMYQLHLWVASNLLTQCMLPLATCVLNLNLYLRKCVCIWHNAGLQILGEELVAFPAAANKSLRKATSGMLCKFRGKVFFFQFMPKFFMCQ